ncbi:MAG: hypothetical protein NTV34_17675 [Proteobacteria bacterium]|nr:hypothetical protein [Pseudomonadota bacterium]
MTAERVKASCNAPAARGLWTGGCIPFGLEPSERRGVLKINPAMQISANEIIDIFIHHTGSLKRTILLMK